MKSYTRWAVVALAAVFVAAPVFAQDDAAEAAPESTMTEEQQMSYAIGTQIGRSISDGGIDVDVDVFVKGLRDRLEGKDLAMSEEEIGSALEAMNQRMREAQQKKQAEMAAENVAKGGAFLEENATNEGVKVLDSGLQYKVMTEGTGKSPTAEDRVSVHYKGTLIDGTQFDSSYDRGEPATFGVTQVIAGWTEALQLMKEGAKWQLFIPSDLAYGERGRPGIPPNSVLIFEVDLLEVQ